MKVTRPRRMRERPERREREWSEARGEETEDRRELEGSSRPDEDRDKYFVGKLVGGLDFKNISIP